MTASYEEVSLECFNRALDVILPPPAAPVVALVPLEPLPRCKGCGEVIPVHMGNSLWCSSLCFAEEDLREEC